MTAQAALQLVLQLIALFPTVEPALVQAIRDFEALFANGGTPSQADVDALLDRVRAQSAAIQAQPD